jgi:putative effector of murein hydrolase
VKVIIYFFKKHRSHVLALTDGTIKFIRGYFTNTSMMEIFITPESVILGVTLYKPYFIREK